MDDKTAFEILKIKPGTSIEQISKRHEHFVLLYKHHLMGESFDMSKEEIELMKRAYEQLLYKKISDDELTDLYPKESRDLSRRFLKIGIQLTRPFYRRHRAKIIYTAVMCIITILVISALDYQPVDLRIAVLGYPSTSDADCDGMNVGLSTAETEILETHKGVKRPDVRYYSLEGSFYDLALFFFVSDADLFILEKNVEKELEAQGIPFLALDGVVPEDSLQAFESVQRESPGNTHVEIKKESRLYEDLCNLQNANQTWVAAISPSAHNLKQAFEFIQIYRAEPTPQ